MLLVLLAAGVETPPEKTVGASDDGVPPPTPPPPSEPQIVPPEQPAQHMKRAEHDVGIALGGSYRTWDAVPIKAGSLSLSYLATWSEWPSWFVDVRPSGLAGVTGEGQSFFAFELTMLQGIRLGPVRAGAGLTLEVASVDRVTLPGSLTVGTIALPVGVSVDIHCEPTWCIDITTIGRYGFLEEWSATLSLGVRYRTRIE